MASKKINCPLVESEIDDEICFDIHMNVEGLAPDWTIPDKVIKKTDYKNVCLNCQTIGMIDTADQKKDWRYSYKHFLRNVPI